MRRKIIVVILAMLISISSITFVNNDIVVKASPGNGEDNSLNFNYLYNLTYNLSQVVNNAPLDHGMQKGREFGTTGEHFTKDNIIKPEMINIFGTGNVTIEQIENIEPIKEENNLTHYLETISQGITIHHNKENKSVKEFYITPRWNDSQNKKLLTYNFSYQGLKIIKRPDDLWLIRATAGAILRIIYEHLPTCPYWQTLAENETLNDPDLLAQAIIKELEDEYNFSFDSSDDLGYDNESLPWYNPAIAGITYPYVFIDEDHSFDPNYNKTRIENLAYENNPIGLFSVFREKILLKARMYFIYELYKHNWSNCTGLILYDHNNDTYNMIYAAGMALPILFINKTDGEDMYNNAKLHYPLPSDDYTIDFYINQSWNESTVSYNVIGQINGTEQNKTVILCSYYDSWRNQGVVDGAVGMSVVLGIGRYMQQLKQTYNITPRFTVKFIAFCGEEVGYRGATYYAATHPNESIQAVIDLNQLGFDQKEPDKNLTLNIAYNVLPFRKTLQEILAPTNYKERTGNTVDFQERWMPLGGPANVKPFTTILLNDPHTFMFIKDTGWTRHHRDGLNHTEGDSMKYFNFTDTQLVTEAIYNFTKYWVYNPDCWFNGTIVTALSDIDSDGHDDTVTATIPIATLLPNDIVMVRGTLKRGIINYQIKREDYIITNENNVVNFSMTIPPSGNHHTDYQLKIELLNSTERIYDKTSLFQGPGSAGEANDTTTLDIHELHPRGNTNPNPPTLTGSADINTTEKYDLTINATDPERDKVSFKINWNSNSGFSFPLWNPETFESGENCT